MTPAAEQVLRAAVRALAGARSTEARTYAEMVAAVLVADGLSPEPIPQGPAVSQGALRQRRYRDRHPPERHSLRNGDASRDALREGGEGGGLSFDLRAEDEDPIKRDLGGPGGVTHNGDASRDVTRDVTRDAPRKITNATDDGAFGATVGAWCEGIASVTGQPCTPPSVGAVRQLVAVLGQHRPVDAEPVAWSRGVAKAYAEASRGRILSPFAFGDWMTSGKPSRPSPSPHDAPGYTGKLPETPEVAAARERAQAAEHARLRREAVPAPAGFATLLGKIGAPGRKVVATTTNGAGRHVGPSSPHPPVEVRQELTDDEREERRRESVRRASEFAETLSASSPKKEERDPDAR